MYEVECTDERYTAESFDRFSTSSQWHVLRDYLLKGLTARWAKILTKMQYNIVRDLIGFCEYVEDRKAGVRKVWKQMKDAFDSFKISVCFCCRFNSLPVSISPRIERIRTILERLCAA